MTRKLQFRPQMMGNGKKCVGCFEGLSKTVNIRLALDAYNARVFIHKYPTFVALITWKREK